MLLDAGIKPMPIELSASRAKINTTKYNRIVAEEISLIDVYIMDAVDNGELSVSINYNTAIAINNTTITGTRITNNDSTGQAYYLAWQGDVDDPKRAAELDSIVSHYEDLGFSIVRTSSNGTTITWKINWQ